MDKLLSDALWDMFMKTGDPLYLNTRAAIEHRESHHRRNHEENR